VSVSEFIRNLVLRGAGLAPAAVPRPQGIAPYEATVNEAPDEAITEELDRAPGDKKTPQSLIAMPIAPNSDTREDVTPKPQSLEIGLVQRFSSSMTEPLTEKSRPPEAPLVQVVTEGERNDTVRARVSNRQSPLAMKPVNKAVAEAESPAVTKPKFLSSFGQSESQRTLETEASKKGKQVGQQSPEGSRTTTTRTLEVVPQSRPSSASEMPLHVTVAEAKSPTVTESKLLTPFGRSEFRKVVEPDVSEVRQLKQQPLEETRTATTRILKIVPRPHLSPVSEMPFSSKSEERSVHVRIGTIEVRAIMPSSPTPRTHRSRPTPALSLEDYLKRRNAGRL